MCVCVCRELDYDLAAVRYTQAVNLVKDINGEPNDEQQAEMNAILTSCWMNLALCFIKLQKYTLAIENCNNVLRTDARNVKTLFRRASAYELNKQLDEARQDLALALECEPENKAVRNQLKIVDHKIQTREQNAERVYAKMFS
jgi:heat shock 70kDa protein 4